MSALLRLTASEARLFSREPMEWGFAIVLPPLLFVALGVIPAFRVHEEGLGGLRVIDLYSPIIVAVAITVLALLTLPQRFAAYRDKKVLRRMRITPARPMLLLSAQLMLCLLVSFVTMVAILAIGRLAFAVSLPHNLLAYLASFALTAVTMLSIGLLVASVAPTGPAAGAIGTVLFFPLLFLAGLWIPRASMPDILLTISDFSPLGAAAQALQDASAGSWPQPLHTAVLIGWSIACGALAARCFRWE
ncbi:ABC transporter permease [Agromyces sp. NPDC056965]|uniref:ABC transporter permease n=1 Tax=Agromyces sp. NPDC056965 TaxID=3345983 RepID=UPI00364246E1